MSFQIRRGTTVKVDAYTPALAELLYDYQQGRLVVGDGVTLGGVPLSRVASAVKLVNAFQLALTGAVTGTVNIDGSGNVNIATSIGATLQSALDLKAPLASPAFTDIPTAPTPPVGTNTTQLATAAMVQAEITNKRAWTSFTPTITATSGTYTSASGTGSYMVAFGICFFKIGITITTKGTGVKPVFTLPLTALAGASGVVNTAKETSGSGRMGTAQLISTTQGSVSMYDGNDLVPGDNTNIIIYGSYPIA